MPSFFVVFVHGCKETFLRELPDFGQKFPSPSDRFFLVKDRKDRFNTLSALLHLHAFQVINSNRHKPLSDPKLLWKIEGENELSNTYVVPKEEMTEEFLKKIDDLLR